MKNKSIKLLKKNNNFFNISFDYIKSSTCIRKKKIIAIIYNK